MRITFSTTSGACPPGKLADVELHFTDGPLWGLRLIGFALWTSRYGDRLNVTFPARSYAVNGERRTFALLRPDEGNQDASNRLRDLIIDAWRAHQDGAQDEPQPQQQRPNDSTSTTTRSTRTDDEIPF